MVEYWTPPPIWPQGTAHILGGGPSLLKTIPNLELLRGRHVIAINDAFRLAQWEVMFFGDARWLAWKHNSRDLRFFRGLKVTTCNTIQYPGVKIVRRGDSRTFSRLADHLMWGASSGATAIDLAIHFGATTIYLFGYDMRPVDGRKNFHANHERDVPDSVYEDRYLGKFAQMRKDADEMGVKIYNCTPDSALVDFEFRDPIEVLTETCSR